MGDVITDGLLIDHVLAHLAEQVTGPPVRGPLIDMLPISRGLSLRTEALVQGSVMRKGAKVGEASSFLIQILVGRIY